MCEAAVERVVQRCELREPQAACFSTQRARSVASAAGGDAGPGSPAHAGGWPDASRALSYRECGGLGSSSFHTSPRSHCRTGTSGAAFQLRGKAVAAAPRWPPSPPGRWTCCCMARRRAARQTHRLRTTLSCNCPSCRRGRPARARRRPRAGCAALRWATLPTARGAPRAKPCSRCCGLHRLTRAAPARPRPPRAPAGARHRQARRRSRCGGSSATLARCASFARLVTRAFRLHRR